MRFFCFLLIVLFLFSCIDDGALEGSNAEAEMEQVFRRWQNFLDQNEFAEVRRLSTRETESLIGTIEELVSFLPEDSTLIHTKFAELKCVQQTDTSGICYYSIADEEVFYRDSIALRKRGRWLVHSPLRIDERDADDLFEEFFQEDLVD